MPFVLKPQSNDQEGKHLITYYPFLEVHITLAEFQVFAPVPVSHNLTVNIAASFKNRSLSPQKYLLPKISGGVEKGEDVKTEPESTQWYTMKGQEAADTN